MTQEPVPSAVVSPVDLAIMRGDVRALSPGDRIALLRKLAEEAELRWAGSPPIILVSSDGKLVPYITKSGADMLAARRGASVVALELVDEGAGLVDANVTVREEGGRQNMDTGSCHYPPDNLQARARARMVATTRGRRRAILGLLGSGFAWNAEAEVEAGLEDPEAEL